MAQYETLVRNKKLVQFKSLSEVWLIHTVPKVLLIQTLQPNIDLFVHFGRSVADSYISVEVMLINSVETKPNQKMKYSASS